MTGPVDHRRNLLSGAVVILLSAAVAAASTVPDASSAKGSTYISALVPNQGSSPPEALNFDDSYHSLSRALSALRSIDGLVGLEGLCLDSAAARDGEAESLFPRCDSAGIAQQPLSPAVAAVEEDYHRNFGSARRLRRAAEDPPEVNEGEGSEVVGVTPVGAEAPSAEFGGAGGGEEGEGGPHPGSYYLFNGLMAFACVCVAALAAGLTLGVLSLDPLMLLIKIRAGATEKERRQAAALLPVVNQHHLLLVTLLLMNSIANEALPLFLDKIFGPLGAVIVSVTLVLFFGEIIPSAVFTGPNQLAIAAALVPLLKLIMALLCPLAWPIAKMLDCLLHDEEEEEKTEHAGMSMYNRSEMAALVRIQYEERLATKKRRKAEMRALGQSVGGSVRNAFAKSDSTAWEEANIDWSERASDSTRSQSLRSVDVQHVAKTYRRELEHRDSQRKALEGVKEVSFGSVTSSVISDHGLLPGVTENVGTSVVGNVATIGTAPDKNTSTASILHHDEVTMVEGALRMTETLAMDAYKPIRSVYSVPFDMILNERNIVDIFSQGYSRVPVYSRDEGSIFNREGGTSVDDDDDGNDDQDEIKKSICGFLLVKNLIVIDPSDERELSTLPLQQPLCVPPTINLVDLLNLMQTGGKGTKGGHMAVVCARPDGANRALDSGSPIPRDAGVMGIITLEDIIEELLQEEIYDENDRIELEAVRRAQWAMGRWKTLVRRRRAARLRMEAMEAAANGGDGSDDESDQKPIDKVVRAAVRFSRVVRESIVGKGGNNDVADVATAASLVREEEDGIRAPSLEDLAEVGESQVSLEDVAEKVRGESEPLLEEASEEDGKGEYKYGTHNLPELN